MNNYIIQLSIYIMSCLLTYYALYSVDFGKIIRKGHSNKVNLIHVLLSFAIGYCVAEFILVILRLRT